MILSGGIHMHRYYRSWSSTGFQSVNICAICEHTLRGEWFSLISQTATDFIPQPEAGWIIEMSLSTSEQFGFYRQWFRSV